MESVRKRIDVSKELAALQHDEKNQSLKKLPKNTTIHRRPLQHAPIASPHAGAHVQKVVYVSRRTPLMSTIKRVKKLLQNVEKRATQGVNLKRQNPAQVMTELAEVSERLAKSSEEVLVKASGRAMEQALRVGEWFKAHEDEMLCKVEVRTNSVAAIDDIVEVQTDSDQEDQEDIMEEPTVVKEEAGDTTLEILRQNADLSELKEDKEREPANEEKQKFKKRRKRKRPVYDKDDLPEARIRWVKTVEVAISLRA